MVRGLIARPDVLGSGNVNSSDPYFIVVGSNNGFWGQQVYKIGISTHWTSGYVTNTCVDHNLDLGFPSYVRTVRCTNESSNPDLDGDSGGPLFLPIGGPYVYLSGTTIGESLDGAGTGWSTISQIQLDFGNGLTVTRATSLNTPSVSGSIPGGAPVLNWPSVSGATTYHVYKSTGGTFSYYTATSIPSFSDGIVAAVAVLGAPPPSAPWVAYYVNAHAPGNYSGNSNVVYFQRNAIVATIQGQFAVQPYETCNWTATASGGTGSYSYQWKVNGQPVGSNSSQLAYANNGSSFTLAVTVTDGAGTPPGSDSRSVSVSPGNPTCGF